MSVFSVRSLLLSGATLLFISCKEGAIKRSSYQIQPIQNNLASIQPNPDTFFYGADLSYVNEMEDCGATYFDSSNTAKDPYEIFGNAGANLVRLRLWHSPAWTAYSNLADVKRSIKRAKDQDMHVLLDFHYSDDWADPNKQEIPKAWSRQINDTQSLGSLLYEYTYTTLYELNQEGLLPEMVQVGNEINRTILSTGEAPDSINWVRNAYLLNKGIDAVRDISDKTKKEIQIMLHIAQPENALPWFRDAKENRVTDFDWIGLSYYPKWSSYSMDSLQPALETLIREHRKKLMIVETAYPYTLENNDEAANLLANDALIPGYPPTEQGQLDYLLALEQIVRRSGGSGVVYWEPAWVSTECKTRWGIGSHWDNATLFDKNGKANQALNFYYNALNAGGL